MFIATILQNYITFWQLLNRPSPNEIIEILTPFYVFMPHVAIWLFCKLVTYNLKLCSRNIAYNLLFKFLLCHADLHRCHEKIYSTSTRPEDWHLKIPFIFGHIPQIVLRSRSDIGNGLTSNSNARLSHWKIPIVPQQIQRNPKVLQRKKESTQPPTEIIGLSRQS